MELNKHLKERTQAVEGEVRTLSGRLATLQSERQAARARTELAVSAERALRPEIEEKDRSVRFVESEVADIERRLRELGDKLKKRNAELAAARLAREAAQRQAHEFRRQTQQEADAVARIEAEMDATAQERSRLHERMRQARLEALVAYAEDVWTELRSMAESGEERRAAREARIRLEQARNSDLRVKQLWESREAWLQMLKTPVPAAVRDTAKTELAKAEAELDTLFPGALKSAEHGGVLGPYELFYCPSAEGGPYDVFLPLPQQLWRSLAQGAAGRSERLAMDLVWGLAQRFSEPAMGTHIVLRAGLPVLRLNLAERHLLDADIQLPLAPAGQLVFMFDSLPSDIEDALHHENTDA